MIDMKLTKQDVCVFIENEAQLQEARELLERYGEKHRFFYEPKEDNFMSLNGSVKWGIYGYKMDHEYLITLTELETILKEEHGNDNK